MRSTEVGTPVASSHGDDAELGDDDGSADGGSDFLGCLDAETDVTLGVANDDNGLESGSLTGTGLLLDGLDLNFHEKRLVSSQTPFPSALYNNRFVRTFMTSSLSLGRKKSTIWYSLMGSECR